MVSWLRAVLLIAVALNGTGCAAVALKVVDEVDTTVSKLLQSDCEMVRVVHGMDVCRSDGLALLPSSYCYKTLGGVDCYDRADPGDRPIIRQATRATAGIN
jgi:hypothetical protein